MSQSMRSVFSMLLFLLSGLNWARADMPRVELSAGIHRIQAEVAANDADRQMGLMNRHNMPQQNGMLFVFEKSERFCMWMKNTFLPLSVAFLDEGGTIVNIANMAPQTEDSHCASKPAKFALEMNLGWFEKRGIRAGAKISGVDRTALSR